MTSVNINLLKRCQNHQMDIGNNKFSRIVLLSCKLTRTINAKGLQYRHTPNCADLDQKSD